MTGDASARSTMTLLQQLTEDAVASDYRPLEPSEVLGSRRGTVITVLGLLALGALLGIAGSATRAAQPSTQVERERLVERVMSMESSVAQVDAHVAEVGADVARLERQALDGSGAGRDVAERLAALDELAGYTAAFGPGVVIELDDADAGGRNADLGRVLDRDLQLVVNGLWRAGATAVAVNGIRLTARTAIRSAGQAILVDYRPLARPYRIAALGALPGLLDSFLDGGTGKMLRELESSYGVRWTAESRDLVELPAATSSLPEPGEAS